MFKRKLGVILAGLMISPSIWGAEESKGSPSSYAAPIPTLIEGLRDRGVRFSVNGQEIAMMKTALEDFSFFQKLTNFPTADNGQLCVLRAEEEDALVKLVPDGNLHLLQLLGCVLAASDPLGLDVPTCIQLILLAQRLGLSDWTDWRHLRKLLDHIKTSRAVMPADLQVELIEVLPLLDHIKTSRAVIPADLLAKLIEALPLLEHIKTKRAVMMKDLPADLQVELIKALPLLDYIKTSRAVMVKDLPADLLAELIEAPPLSAESNQVLAEHFWLDWTDGGSGAGIREIIWQPQEMGFFVIYHKGKAQRYSAAGIPVGTVLTNVADVTWQPQGQGFFVRHRNGMGQQYNDLGMPVGAALTNIYDITWHPQGDGYFVIYWGGTAQRYDATGASVGELLNFVYWILWHPQGDGYFVIYKNFTAQRYDATGASVGELLNFVYWILWHPQGDGYFMKHPTNGTTQRYDAMGAPTGTPLTDVDEIFCHPRGDDYFVKYLNGRVQRYNGAGAPVGEPLTNVKKIVWHPEKLECLVHYHDHYDRMVYYDLNGLIIYHTTKVAGVQWLPNGQGYVLIYRSGEVQVKYRPDYYFADLRWVGLQTRTHSYKLFINQLGTLLLVQAIANQFAQTGSPVPLPTAVQTMLPAEIWKTLSGLGMTLPELAAAPTMPELPVASAAASKNYFSIAASTVSVVAIGAAVMAMKYYFSRK